MQPIGTVEFESPMVLEGSWGTRKLSDKAKSRMSLYLNRDTTGYIEWECEELDIFEEIGLVFEFDASGKRTLVDYDGVFSLPSEAMKLCEAHGIDCAEMRASLDGD